MEFGHVYDSLEEVDFRLPPDSVGTAQTLATSKPHGELRVYVGASRFSVKDWRGELFTRATAESDFLSIYARNFNTVEFGVTFYSIYDAEYIKGWADKVAESPQFRFLPKFPQTITHIRRLYNAEDITIKFYESLRGFGSHIGLLLLQLGNNFTPKSFKHLKDYLESLPTEFKICIEVRHQDWYRVPTFRKELFELLTRLGIAWCIPDTAGRRDCVHMELTTPDAVVRFVGNSPDKSDYMRLDAWVNRIKLWREQGLQSVWFYVHQHEERDTPRTCDYFIEQLNLKLGLSVKRPILL